MALGTAKQIVEINGRKYDAATGRLIENSAGTPPAKAAKAPVKGAVLDGFMRTKPLAPNKLARHAQKSKTLMRPAVTKPKVETAKSTPKVQQSSSSRLHRATSVPKSSKISRFNRHSAATSKVVKKSSALPVATPHRAASPQPMQPAVEQFERAMHEATSHLQTFVPKKNTRRRRRLAIASLCLVGLIAVGGLAYQIMPLAKVKYAGTRAGFSASLPNYNPTGFGLNSDIAAGSGEVTLTYSSRTDDKNYKIKQTPSNWNSQALLANYVMPTYGANNYQSYESQGKTVYINNNSNATWVDGGVWYRLEGNASLTSDQLQRIVNSL